MKKLVMLTLLVLSALLIACAREDLPPEPPRPGATSGGAFAGRAVYAGEGQYAEDTADFFNISSDTPAFGETLTATCEGDQFIYGIGYDTDVDGQWRAFDYGFCQRVGAWCRGSTTVQRFIKAENYAVGDNYVLCYGCTKEAGQWNCHWAFAGGGGRWMAHQFNVHEPAATQVCGNGAVEEGEECDDNNLINGDGCSAGCVVEAPIVECTLDADCAEGEVCNDDGMGGRQCIVPVTGGCTSDVDCTSGSVCNMEFHQCVEVAGGCSTDADCTGNFFCNAAEQCEELPIGPEGPGGETELAAEDCFDELDNNDDGQVNEGCEPYSCVEHTTQYPASSLPVYETVNVTVSSANGQTQDWSDSCPSTFSSSNLLKQECRSAPAAGSPAYLLNRTTNQYCGSSIYHCVDSDGELGSTPAVCQ